MAADRTRPRRRTTPAALIILTVAGVIAPTTLGSSGLGARHRQPPHPAAERPAPPLMRRLTIGRSVNGSPIRAIRIGQAGDSRTLLIVGCIHGNEPAGIAIARHLATASAPPRSALWIILELRVATEAGLGRRSCPHLRFARSAHGADRRRTYPTGSGCGSPEVTRGRAGVTGVPCRSGGFGCCLEARAPRRGGGVVLEGRFMACWAGLAGVLGCSAGLGGRVVGARDAAEES